MGIKTPVVFLRETELLAVLGKNLKRARLRRQLTMRQVAARAGIGGETLREIERGNPRVNIAAYINVLRVYHLSEDILKVAGDEELKRKLLDI